MFRQLFLNHKGSCPEVIFKSAALKFFVKLSGDYDGEELFLKQAEFGHLTILLKTELPRQKTIDKRRNLAILAPFKFATSKIKLDISYTSFRSN